MEENRVPVDISINIISNVFGRLDENIKKIEKAFNVNVVNRSGGLVISGRGEDAARAENVIRKLISFAEKGEEIRAQNVNYLISLGRDEGISGVERIADDHVGVTAAGKPIKPKTLGQKKYLDTIRGNTIVFGVGPAGTGKTYLAMAVAISEFKAGRVNRIILTRPAIEAGEKLGFLPGDLQQKVDPYLRPLYDALHEIMGTDTFQKNLEKGSIEVAPLAYMRGRTLDNAFIVLDEAQNTTPEQMKMFLTRIGFSSKAIITGDLTQIDLPSGKISGLVEAVKVLAGIEDIGISQLTAKDVVRHPLVAKIIEAYDKHENREKKRSNAKEGRNGSGPRYGKRRGSGRA